MEPWKEWIIKEMRNAAAILIDSEMMTIKKRILTYKTGRKEDIGMEVVGKLRKNLV